MANRPASDVVPGEVTRLTNRAAALAFAAAIAIIIALVSIPAAVRPGEPARRIAAAVATVVAAGVTVRAWRARAQLGDARAREARERGAAPVTGGRAR